MFSYAEAKQRVIDGLTHDADAHESGRYGDIGIGFDEFDAGLPRDDDTKLHKLFIALAFWDGWIDARNHDWQYYEGINEADWPVLAKRIVASLAEDQEITEPVVLRRFDLQESQPRKKFVNSLLGRLRGA